MKGSSQNHRVVITITCQHSLLHLTLCSVAKPASSHTDDDKRFRSVTKQIYTNETDD